MIRPSPSVSNSFNRSSWRSELSSSTSFCSFGSGPFIFASTAGDFEGTGGKAFAVPDFGIGGGPAPPPGLGTGGVGGFGPGALLGVTGKSSSISNPLGKPGSGSLIFPVIGLGGGPSVEGKVFFGTGGTFAASGDEDAGLGSSGTVGPMGAGEVG